MRTGFSQLPLHDGKAPRWLFQRMVLLAREIHCHEVSEYGADEALVRLSDPCRFQALDGTVTVVHKGQLMDYRILASGEPPVPLDDGKVSTTPSNRPKHVHRQDPTGSLLQTISGAAH